MKTTLLALSLILSTLGAQSFAAETQACDEACMKHCESAQMSCQNNGTGCPIKNRDESNVKTERATARKIFVDKGNY